MNTLNKILRFKSKYLQICYLKALLEVFSYLENMAFTVKTGN